MIIGLQAYGEHVVYKTSNSFSLFGEFCSFFALSFELFFQDMGIGWVELVDEKDDSFFMILAQKIG